MADAIGIEVVLLWQGNLEHHVLIGRHSAQLSRMAAMSNPSALPFSGQ
jgi:hypothetical protein